MVGITLMRMAAQAVQRGGVETVLTCPGNAQREVPVERLQRGIMAGWQIGADARCFAV
jgi:hypothetical protein